MHPNIDHTSGSPGGFDQTRWHALQSTTFGDEPWRSLPGHLHRSSQGLPWPGLAVWHQVGPLGDLYVPPTVSHTILVRRSMATELLQRHGPVMEATHWQPGQSLVVPAGVPSFWRSSMPRDNIHIDLAPSWLQRTAHAEVSLQSSFGREDPVLASFAQLLMSSLDSNAALHGGFAEHIAQAIALHLLAHYARPNAALAGGAWLTRRQTLLITDAVRADLREPWPVGRLAALAGLSPFHFSRAFKASLGLPPHAWVSQQRMEAAARLVSTTTLPLTEVADATGYRSATHFAQAFRRHWGMSPSAYRRTT